MNTILVPVSSLSCLAAWQDYRARLVETFPVKEESTKSGRIALREAQYPHEPGQEQSLPARPNAAHQRASPQPPDQTNPNLLGDTTMNKCGGKGKGKGKGK